MVSNEKIVVAYWKRNTSASDSHFRVDASLRCPSQAKETLMTTDGATWMTISGVFAYQADLKVGGIILIILGLLELLLPRLRRHP